MSLRPQRWLFMSASVFVVGAASGGRTVACVTGPFAVDTEWLHRPTVPHQSQKFTEATVAESEVLTTSTKLTPPLLKEPIQPTPITLFTKRVGIISAPPLQSAPFSRSTISLVPREAATLRPPCPSPTADTMRRSSRRLTAMSWSTSSRWDPDVSCGREQKC